MLQQAVDFKTESDALYQLLKPLSDEDLEQTTQFKDWTLNTVLQHLHYFNYAADMSLKDEQGILQLLKNLQESQKTGESLVAYTDRQLDGIKGQSLLRLWRDYYTGMAGSFREADPKKRVKWAGPDMSVLSSITARLMETWSHGQEVYDLLGVVREDSNYIKNIVVIGNNTFGWTFVNRGEETPYNKPFLRLCGPTGDVWEFNDHSEDNHIEGSATEFCQVVTQTRNIQDTTLNVVGKTANRWMAVAQCFAGPPRNPPARGTRYTRNSDRHRM
ncbi:MAG: hypothetical protein CFH35_02003 [Alphaproteobacteria bacterium MarineAlpha9_Bin5]|nr:MAG: hypothetical protein CFH35_02003 [Alphaproteobacteria bacterium MarineAlpha9_Bin5]